MLKDLVTIKEFRERKAERALIESRAALAQAVKVHEAAQVRLTDYRVWSLREERAMFEQICTRAVKVRDIELLREDVLLLRDKERTLEAALEQADVTRKRADATLQTSRVAHGAALRVRQKFTDLAQQVTEEAASEASRKEEGELEELAGTRIRRDHTEVHDVR